MRPFPARAKAPTRLLSLSTYALLGAVCLTACKGEDDPDPGAGSGTGSGNEGGRAGTSSLGVGGNGNRGGSAGASAGTGGSAGKGGTAGAAGKGGGGGKGGTGGAGGSAGKGGNAGTTQGGDAGSGGTQAGAAGASGFGGGNIVCATVADCPGPAATNECGGWVCEQSLCFSAFAAKDEVASLQKAGDCVTKVCDGAGALVDRADAADVPDDNNECTKDVCVGTVPSHDNLAAGDACGNGLTCDGAGKCTGCGKASDCQAGDACKTPTCTKGVCGFVFSSASTPLPDAVANDCKRAACDGNGRIVDVASASDLPVDGTVCTQDVCVNGAPANLPTNLGQPCEGGGLCNDAGKCVACLEPSTCPGQDTECERRTCDDNVCGTVLVPYGESVLNQTAGDCSKNVCDGAGKVINVVDDADVADDDNACTTDACALGIVSHQPVPTGTACGASLLCNAEGKCVGCVTPNDCAGTDDACKARTCVDSVCGVAYAPSGTPLADPTDGDCKGRFCDGAGNIVDGADPSDVRVDGNVCSRDICYNGNPANPASPAGSDCGGGNICSGTGACVQCLTAATCPGQDNDCQTRTCIAGVCKLVFAPPSTVADTQITGDCLVNVCDGAGKIVSQPNTDDVRDDNNVCTTDTCGAGGPVNTPVKPGQPCGEGGVCEAGGVCGGCKSPDDCPGVDNECQSRTCEAGLCGFSFQQDGATTEGGQKPNDCKRVVCDGAGNTKSIDDGDDVPLDDGFFCTNETCQNGNPQHPPKGAGTACPRTPGGFCDGNTSCVACLVPEHCPGEDTFCSFRTCSSGVCGTGRMPADTELPPAQQNPGDCRKLRCDNEGFVTSAADDTDLPPDEGNQCTFDQCSGGQPVFPPRPAGTTCTIQSEPHVCDGASSCVFCLDDTQCAGGKICDLTENICVAPSPQVTSTSPADGATSIDPRGAIGLVFNMAMKPASLVAQTTSGPCTGSVQLSADDFATCVGFGAGGAPTMSNGDTAASFQPAVGLAVNTVYKIKVTSAATNAADVAATPFVHATGFQTAALAGLCDGNVVISQVYPSGGNTGASFNRDFVELHNRGTTPVSVAGWSVQYASATGTSWGVAGLTGSIPAGGYYLVGMQIGANGAALPTPVDATGALNMAIAGGKVALVSNGTALPGVACPTTSASLVDLVTWGTANCPTTPDAPAPAATDAAKSIVRKLSGCQDARNPFEDFAVSSGNAAPRNSVTTAIQCDCRAVNESESTDEMDACQLVTASLTQLPPNVTTPAISGNVLVSGATWPNTSLAGHAANLRMQLGYATTHTNPQYEAGWTWLEAGYTGDSTNRDVFSGAFPVTGPTPRTYRYVYRASHDGLNWTYCDTDGSGRGAATFDPAKLGKVTVDTPPS